MYRGRIKLIESQEENIKEYPNINKSIDKYSTHWRYVAHNARAQKRQASTDDMDNTSGIALWRRHIRGPHSTQISDTDTRRGDTGYMIQISHTYKIIIRIIIMVFMINIITSLHYITLKKGW